MNVLISVNELYLNKAETMLFSLHRNTLESINVFMINHSLNSKHINKFYRFINRYNMKLHVVDVDSSVFDNMTLGSSHFSIEMYYRIMAQFILPEDLERILWLDADIIINKDLKEFYFQNLDGKAMAVCPDSKNSSDIVSTIKDKIGLPKEHTYFNSGVLLLNLSYLRNNTNINDIISVLNKLKDKLTYPDQDILNCLYTNKVKYNLWEKYNFQVIDMDFADEKKINNASIIHYSGPRKPWCFRDVDRFSKFYWKYELLRGSIFKFLLCYFLKALVTIKRKAIQVLN